MLGLSGGAFASSPEGSGNLFKNEMKYFFGEDGTSWSKFSMATQFWARHTYLNPGSTNKAGDPIDSEFEFALRRTRFTLHNNLNDRIIFYTQLGFNNLNSTSSKPQLYFHDVWAMFRVAPKLCYMGFGLSGWNGLSRLSNTSYQKTLTLDNPGVNYPNINHTDLEGRQLGIFAKGTIGQLSYRAILAKPFAYNGIPTQPKANIGYEYPSEKLEYKGYFAWYFFDKEYFSTPYVDMTYLGTKRICNLGFGFDIYPKSIAQYDDSGNRRLKNRNLFAADFMLDLPFKNKQTVTIYTVAYFYDLGKNHLRASSVMNNWRGGTGAEGAGNNEFKMGTGTINYTSLGYLFPKDLLKLDGQFQFFYALTYKNFDALDVNLTNHDFGLNYYIAGQKLKIGIQHSLRPYRGATNSDYAEHKATTLLQIQIVI